MSGLLCRRDLSRIQPLQLELDLLYLCVVSQCYRVVAAAEMMLVVEMAAETAMVLVAERGTEGIVVLEDVISCSRSQCEPSTSGYLENIPDSDR